VAEDPVHARQVARAVQALDRRRLARNNVRARRCRGGRQVPRRRVLPASGRRTGGEDQVAASFICGVRPLNDHSFF
jgi:hypothetical protein